jgi:hypothetical protein
MHACMCIACERSTFGNDCILSSFFSFILTSNKFGLVVFVYVFVCMLIVCAYACLCICVRRTLRGHSSYVNSVSMFFFLMTMCGLACACDYNTREDRTLYIHTCMHTYTHTFSNSP